MSNSRPPVASRRGPAAALLDLFSSVWLGVSLLSVLFIYSWIGSAGVPVWLGGPPWSAEAWNFMQVRQFPALELTEFEWFHWWPFDLLIGLICANLVITTLRRIRLSLVNLGVWGIHTGILVLAAGSVIYFTGKVEGDTPVARRRVSVALAGGQELSFPAVPGTRAALEAPDGSYRFLVSDVDPAWVLLSGPDAGQPAFSVQVDVTTPRERFVRQLIDGQPDATQDSLFAEDAEGPPLRRAVEVLGRKFADESIAMTLGAAPQRWFYEANWIQKSWALYLRERGAPEWTQRPVEGLPLYNDHVTSVEEVWVPDGESLPPRPLRLDVPPAEAGDPLANLSLMITSYLRYAQLERRFVPGASLAPTARVQLEDRNGEVFEHELVAFDPRLAESGGGFLALRWVEDEAAREALGRSSAAVLHVSIPGIEGEVEHVVTDVSVRDAALPWIEVPGSDYAFRVQFVEALDEPGLPLAIASVELRQGDRRWRRFVSEDRRFIRDVDAGDDGLTPTETYDLDEGIEIDFHPARRPAAVTLVAGPAEDDLGVVLALGSAIDGIWQPLAVGEACSLGGGDTLTVGSYLARSQAQTRPAITAASRRDRDAREAFSMVRVQLSEGGRLHDAWVPFHQYPITGPAETLRRYWYDPAEIQLGDGRTIEVILSRRRWPLPSPVVLDDFRIDSHVGGFTGRTSSILNWTSELRFLDPGTPDGVPAQVAVNRPAEHRGLWFFQAQWDPPAPSRGPGDPSSRGLNYTVLGVGNRMGVGIQLLGCSIAVAGMLYAFYVKPQLLRRRRRALAEPQA